MTVSCDLIDDGYTENGYIAAEEGKHGELFFEYRPSVPKLADKIGSMIPDWDRFWPEVAKSLARDPHLLLNWSLVDSKGQPAALSELNILKLKPLLAHKLWGVVSGNRASDPRPDGVQTKKPDFETDGKN